MQLPPGTRLGSFEVIGGLGAGAMGEVYRARDTVLQREVALKLVHPDFCHHPDSLARLRREARALAALNHPNVATLHGLEEFGGSCGLVMELIGGDTLAELLRRQPPQVDQALRLATQMAAALEAAHDGGIIHRDLKPANVKVTRDGTVKVIDFGLAKTSGDAADGTASTLMTAAGAVLGTFPYMSPEQARGEELDRRTDIWAFGCVLYEMLTGRLAFDGGSRSDIVVAILEREPDWAALPPAVPPSIDRLIRRCLHKNRHRRLRDIGDARLEIEDALAGDRPSAPPTAIASTRPARRDSWLRAGAWLAIGAVLGSLAVLGWPRARPSATASEVRFSIALPDDERLASTELGALAIHPEGRSLVYVSQRGATTQLVLRTLDGGAARPLPGTMGALTPFFSPDGNWVGFFAEGKLKKVPASGGAPVAICDAPEGLGGSWGASGTIVFASASGAPLQQVSADGGVPVRATELDVSRGEFSHRWPEFLPDGDTVLFTIGTVGDWDDAEIAAHSLQDGTRTSILKGGTNPRYLSSGHLAYAHDGAVWAAAFDADRRTVTGPATRVLEGVATSADGAAQFVAAGTGTVAYHPRVPQSSRRLVVVEGGVHTPLAAPPHSYITPRVSPDGRRVVVGVTDDGEHVWSYDLNTGRLVQLTFEAANQVPIWSADGSGVTFASNRNGPLNFFISPADADGPTERLTTADALQLPGAWAPDGAALAFMEQHPATGRDVWLMRRNGERTAVANSAADESAPRFSPDGRWIAYVSNAAGAPQVYVRPTDGSSAAGPVSPASGSEPVWRPDSRAVYFRSAGRLLVAPLGGGGAQVVYDGAFEPGTFDAAGYDVIGVNRFLMIMSASEDSQTSELRVILNWVRPATSLP